MKAKTMNVLAMSVFGTLAIFVRGIALGSLETAFWRAVIAIAVLLLLRLVTPASRGDRLCWKERGILLLSGMIVGVNWVFLFLSYAHTSVAVATLAYYFAPVLVMVLSTLLFREKMTALQVGCFAAATVGLALVIGGGGLGQGNLLGVVCGLAAACFYAAAVIVNKSMRRGTGLDRTLWQFTGAALLLLGPVLLRGGFRVFGSDAASFCNLLIVGVVHTGLCYWLYFTSIRDLPGHQTAILSYIDPLVAILVSVFVLREAVGALQWVGAAMILGFTCLSQVVDGAPAKKS